MWVFSRRVLIISRNYDFSCLRLSLGTIYISYTRRGCRKFLMDPWVCQMSVWCFSSTVLYISQCAESECNLVLLFTFCSLSDFSFSERKVVSVFTVDQVIIVNVVAFLYLFWWFVSQLAFIFQELMTNARHKFSISNLYSNHLKSLRM